MKRLIKYWNRYNTDGHKFSDCSTEYELFPIIVSDDAGNKELRALAAKVGVKLKGKAVPELKRSEGYCGARELKITNAIKTTETHKRIYFGKTESNQVWLGFITIPNGDLEIKETLGNELTKKEANEIVNMDSGVFGVDSVGEMYDGKQIIVMAGWNYFHALKLAGYSPDSFRKAFGVDNEDGEYFYDSVERCYGCDTYDHADNGYTYNHRVLNDCTVLGLNCGCYDEHMASPEALEDFINDDKQCVEASVMEKHDAAGRARKLETYIGGMTDGRGGYIGGKFVKDGNPKEVLADWLSKFPNGRFVFSRDDSGQFQTYFSIWEILPEKKKRSKSKGKRIEK